LLLKNQFKKKILCLTGASGNLGRIFSKKYSKKYKILNYPYRIENTNKFKKWVKRNDKINYFLHFAGISGSKNINSKVCLKINYKSTINILKTLNKLELKNFKYFLFVSSSHVYKFSNNKLKENDKRAPKTTYALSKKKTEDFILDKKNKFNYKIGIARIFNFTSKLQIQGYLVPDLVNFIEKNKSKLMIKLNKFNSFRDFIHVHEVCSSLNLMIKKNFDGPLNIASGNKTNIVSLAKVIAKEKRIKGKIITTNKPSNSLIADISKLKKIGYLPKKNIKTFIKEYL